MLCVKTKRTRLSEFVKKKLRIPLTETGEPVLVMPRNYLVPVASLDNIKLLGGNALKKIDLCIHPSSRYEMLKRVINSVSEGSGVRGEWIVKHGGVEIKVNIDRVVKPSENRIYRA